MCFPICTLSIFTLCQRDFLPTNLFRPVGKAGADILTKVGRRAMSIEATPLAMLVRDEVEEGKLGMITAFCRTDQAKGEPLDSLLTLVQHESPKPGVVVGLH